MILHPQEYRQHRCEKYTNMGENDSKCMHEYGGVRTVSFVDLENGHSHVHVLRCSVAAHVLLMHLQNTVQIYHCANVMRRIGYGYKQIKWRPQCKKKKKNTGSSTSMIKSPFLDTSRTYIGTFTPNVKKIYIKKCAYLEIKRHF